MISILCSCCSHAYAVRKIGDPNMGICDDCLKRVDSPILKFIKRIFHKVAP